MIVVYAVWCESERCVHYSFEDRALADHWQELYDEPDSPFGCGPHRVAPCREDQ